MAKRLLVVETSCTDAARKTDDVGGALKALNDNKDKKRAEGRCSELLLRVSRCVYRQISSLSK